jgi:alanine dehydrogenase
VVILGGGTAGTQAVQTAVGMGARVTVLDNSLSRLRWLSSQFHTKISTLYATHEAIELAVATADLLVGAVLVPGATAPKLVSKEMISAMQKGSVVVDVAIDQGGCFMTSHPTTHDHPTYVVDDVVHYCVTNMPGAVGRTSTFALCNVTLPWVVHIAEKGIDSSISESKPLRESLNIHRGKVTNQAVAQTFDMQFEPV